MNDTCFACTRSMWTDSKKAGYSLDCSHVTLLRQCSRWVDSSCGCDVWIHLRPAHSPEASQSNRVMHSDLVHKKKRQPPWSPGQPHGEHGSTTSLLWCSSMRWCQLLCVSTASGRTHGCAPLTPKCSRKNLRYVGQMTLQGGNNCTPQCPIRAEQLPPCPWGPCFENVYWVFYLHCCAR